MNETLVVHTPKARLLPRFCRFAAIFAVATGACAARAQTVTLHLRPEKTEILFTAGSSLHRVHGSFVLKGGQVAFDAAAGVAQGQILVDASSEHSDNAKLDSRIQNEVLESTKYPELFFHAEKSSGGLKQGDDQHLALIGTFNAHGADHPLKIDAIVSVHGDQAVARAEWDVPYVEWGMKDASTMLLHARTVHISMVAHATVEGLQAAK